eukprot:TRINITY_DN10144_c0_g1_i1.p1 TRINITY_DN10144_c0_g1~~TRINITY_DN10144_c0_g1_i1.p1  ORF type:complete len:558 (-),score=50.09 TRINITY_DN10144_c0_g1_i1:102-1775(-)
MSTPPPAHARFAPYSAEPVESHEDYHNPDDMQTDESPNRNERASHDGGESHARIRRYAPRGREQFFGQVAQPDSDPQLQVFRGTAQPWRQGYRSDHRQSRLQNTVVNYGPVPGVSEQDISRVHRQEPTGPARRPRQPPHRAAVPPTQEAPYQNGGRPPPAQRSGAGRHQLPTQQAFRDDLASRQPVSYQPPMRSPGPGPVPAFPTALEPPAPFPYYPLSPPQYNQPRPSNLRSGDGTSRHERPERHWQPPRALDFTHTSPVPAAPQARYSPPPQPARPVSPPEAASASEESDAELARRLQEEEWDQFRTAIPDEEEEEHEWAPFQAQVHAHAHPHAYAQAHARMYDPRHRQHVHDAFRERHLPFRNAGPYGHHQEERPYTLHQLHERVQLLQALAMHGRMGGFMMECALGGGVDVDNMSYEELLELEERIGKVNTGVSGDRLESLTSRSVLSTVPTSDSTCCICVSEYEVSEEIRTLPCSHFYHRECVDKWLAENRTCPVCKEDVLGPEEVPQSTAQAGEAPRSVSPPQHFYRGFAYDSDMDSSEGQGAYAEGYYSD